MRFNQIIIILVTIITVSCSCSATEGNSLSQLGFYSSPDQILQALEKNADSAAEHYLLGVTYKKRGNLKRSLYHFANACFSSARNTKLRLFPQPVYSFTTEMHIKSPYYSDAISEIAAIFFQYREFAYVIRFADLIKNDVTAVYRDTMILKARSQAEAGSADDALKTLSTLLVTYTPYESSALIHIRMASVFEKLSRDADALKHYLAILKKDSDSWQSGLASDSAAAYIIKGLPASPYDRFLVGRALYRNGKFNEAAAHLSYALAGIRAEQTKKDCLLFLMRSLVRAGRLNEADEIVRSAGNHGMLSEDLALVKADELWESRKKTAAIKEYSSLRSARNTATARHALKRTALYLEERRASGFTTILHEFINKYPDDPAADFFTWALGRESLRNKNYPVSMKLFKEGIARNPRSDNSDRMRFWLYKLYLKENNPAGAHSLLRQMAAYNPDSTYTWSLLNANSSSFREAELNENFESSLAKSDAEGYLYSHTALFMLERDINNRNARIKRIPPSATAGYASLNERIRSLDLRSSSRRVLKSLERYFEAGDTDAVNRELEIIAKDDAIKNDIYLALAHFGLKYGNHYLSSIAILELLRSAGLPENMTLMPSESLACLLPIPFEKCVDDAASRYKLEQGVLYALIKAESLFNHRAVSPAGATGLMQLMPATAKGIARELKLSSFDLKEPCTSVLFGAHYLAWLHRFFKGNLNYMVAGYNAGAGNVEKWRSLMKGEDDDYFAEYIPFDETRYYIVRTKKFLYQYRIVLGDQ